MDSRAETLVLRPGIFALSALPDPIDVRGIGSHLASSSMLVLTNNALEEEDPGSRESSLGPLTAPSLTSGPSTPATTGSYSSSGLPELPYSSGFSLDSLAHPEVSRHYSLAEEEATQEDLDAAEQADDSIIVDDTATDAGYESDPASSVSTSLSDSVQGYIFENGRRYHKFREGRYNFPNDAVEQEREDMKHAMVKLLCGTLHYAPIGDYPQEILDIGTGTGTWAIEMGDQYPGAKVLGVDLSPIQPDWVPPNVKFMVDDVESPWLHPRNHFDFIHSRHTIMGIKDWPRLMRRAYEHLRPGGFVELQEIHHSPLSAAGPFPPTHPVAQYWRHVQDGLAALGVDLHAAAAGRLAALLRACGYADVTERVVHVPVGPWPRDRVLRAVGVYWRAILLDGVQAIALGPLMRGLGWTRERVELFLVEVRRAYTDEECWLYMPMTVVYGRKPLHGY